MSLKVLHCYAFSWETGYINGVVWKGDFSWVFDLIYSKSSNEFENKDKDHEEDAIGHISTN